MSLRRCEKFAPKAQGGSRGSNPQDLKIQLDFRAEAMPMSS